MRNVRQCIYVMLLHGDAANIPAVKHNRLRDINKCLRRLSRGGVCKGRQACLHRVVDDHIKADNVNLLSIVATELY